MKNTLKGVSAVTVIKTDPSPDSSADIVTPLGPVLNND